METTPKRDNTNRSCTVCKRRKVKCDRLFPCQPCRKSGLECVFPETSGPRAKRVKRSSSPKASPGPRIHDLISHGNGSANNTAFSPAQPVKAELPTSRTAKTGTAQLVSDGSGVRYVNNHLWNSLSEGTNIVSPQTTSSPATIGPNGRLQSISEHDDRTPDTTVNLFFGNNAAASQQLVQPPAHLVVQLWQAYLRNVDPVMKLLHAPTTQQLIMGRINKQGLPANEQALIFSTYFISVVSMSEEECLNELQLSRKELVKQYQTQTELALSAANFVTTTDMMVLQALVHYLAGIRSLGDPTTVWSMLGLAIRLAGTTGLVRDGSSFDLPPFEIELRRRLFYAIVYLDARTAELVGQDGDLLVQNFETRLPLNLNDSDLFPGMQRLPDERIGATEMIYIVMRGCVASSLRERWEGPTSQGGIWARMRDVDEKTGFVERVEAYLHDRVVRYCDKTVPLQLLTMIQSETFVLKLRLVGRRSDGGGRPGAADHDAFALSLRLIELQITMFSDPGLQKFRWQFSGYFQLYALSVLLRETRNRPSDAATIRSWSVIHHVFEHIMPSLDIGPRKSPLLAALRTMLDAAVTSRPPAVHLQPAPSVHHYPRPEAQPLAPYQFVGPGIPTMQTASPAFVRVSEPMFIPDETLYDPFVGFDFGAMDWAEFDRLTSELCER